MIEIVTECKRLRYQHMMRQREVAAAANMSESQYCLIESGKRPLTAKMAMRIAPVFHMDWVQLYELSNGITKDGVTA